MKKQDKKEVLLVQWQTCVEMANAISQRRDSMNNLFVTLNLAIIAAISFMWDLKTIILSIAGVAVCGVWCLFIRNFKALNAEKFKVINTIEEYLPIKAFQNEWDAIKQNKKYKEGTKLELILPLVFCVLYITIIIIIVATNCCGNGGN